MGKIDFGDLPKLLRAATRREMERLRRAIAEPIGDPHRIAAELLELAEYVEQQPPVQHETAAANKMREAADMLRRLADGPR